MLGGTAKFMATIGKSRRQDGQIELVDIAQNDNVVAHSMYVDYDQSRMRNLIKGDVINFTSIIMVYDGLDDEGETIKKAKLTQIRNIARIM